MRISIKLTTIALLITGIPLAFVSSLIFINAKENLLNETKVKLDLASKLEGNRVRSIIEESKTDFFLFQNDNSLISNFEILTDGNGSTLANKKEAHHKLTSKVETLLKIKGNWISDILLISPNKEILIDGFPNNVFSESNQIFSDTLKKVIEKLNLGYYVSPVFIADSNNNISNIVIIGPLITDNNMFIGNIVAVINMSIFYNNSSTTDDLGVTGETYLINDEKMMITPSRFIKHAPLKVKVETEITEQYFLNGSSKKTQEGSSTFFKPYPDYRGVLVYGSSMYIPELNWVIITEIDANEVFVPVNNLRAFIRTITLIVLLIILIITLPTSIAISNPINVLIAGVRIIGKGNLQYKVATDQKNEVGTLSREFDKMILDLRQVTATKDELNIEIEERIKAEEHNKKLLLQTSEAKDEAEQAFKKLKEAKNQLVQSEKMASIGQLTAGVAHELNNPINFIAVGSTALKTDVKDVIELLDKYQELSSSTDINKGIKEIESFQKEIDIEFLEKNILQTIDDIHTGTKRVNSIVTGLRKFSRIDEEDQVLADIHSGLNETLTMLNSQLKNRIKVIKNYDEKLEPISCFPGELNQVFMNLIVNASQAINDKGEITITTRDFSNEIEIKIKDNGSGIDQEVLNRIFDPFFTTKEVGEGTGLGLSISYGIIEKHGGTIEAVSGIGKGAEFTIKLPKENKS